MKRPSKFLNRKVTLVGSWSPEADEQLIELRQARKSIPQVADLMGRTESSIENRWLRLRKERGLKRVRGLKVEDPAAHFWARVDQSEGPDACWPWKAKARYLHGYGALVFNVGDGWKNYGAHRIAFFLAEGRTQAPGLDVMHSCDNKICCNPAHLREGTRSENTRDAWARGRFGEINRKRGTAHHGATVTETQVVAIRRLREAGAKREDIAEAAGITVAALDHIIARRSWKWVA